MQAYGRPIHTRDPKHQADGLDPTAVSCASPSEDLKPMAVPPTSPTVVLEPMAMILESLFQRSAMRRLHAQWWKLASLYQWDEGSMSPG